MTGRAQESVQFGNQTGVKATDFGAGEGSRVSGQERGKKPAGGGGGGEKIPNLFQSPPPPKSRAKSFLSRFASNVNANLSFEDSMPHDYY